MAGEEAGGFPYVRERDMSAYLQLKNILDTIEFLLESIG